MAEDTIETVQLTTADLLEIAAGGGNGAELVDLPRLLEDAAKELRALEAENAAMAAWQCVHFDGKTGLTADEHGNQVCAKDARIAALEAEVERLKEALRFYANAEVYKPHPHGPAFDDRDLSFHARAALGKEGA